MKEITIRVATAEDIPQIQVVRNAVKENQLSDPALVSDADCAHYLTERGKGWVAVVNETVVGFAIADLVEHNIWALFLHPDFEKKGIGKQLHDAMMDWYFQQTPVTVWLSTAPDTRAAAFYKKAGWTENGTYGKGELKFEMEATKWQQL